MAKAKQGKKIAGIKIPKSLRKAGKSAKKLAQEPIVSELVVAALTAAAAQLATTKTGKNVRREAGEAASATAREGGAIGASVKKVLIDAARSLLDSYEDKAAGGEKKPSPARKKGGRKSAERG